MTGGEVARIYERLRDLTSSKVICGNIAIEKKVVGPEDLRFLHLSRGCVNVDTPVLLI